MTWGGRAPKQSHCPEVISQSLQRMGVGSIWLQSPFLQLGWVGQAIPKGSLHTQLRPLLTSQISLGSRAK